MVSSYDKAVLTRRMRRGVLPVEFLRETYAAVKHRLSAKSAGRVVMADLERDLQADNTRVRVALSLLEEAGLLRRGPDLPRAALVHLSAACRDDALPDDLAAFRRAARLRPRQWLTLDLAGVAPKAGIALAEIEQKVLAWEDAGWLTYRPAGRDLLVELLPSPEGATEQVETLLERYETVQTQRVDEIAAYAETRRCRHGHLNAYLGGRAIERCDACDNCVAVAPPPDPDLPDEETQLLIILGCVANAPWSWGRRTLTRLLRGDDKARYGGHSLHDSACAQAEFGALSFRSNTAVRRMIERLEYAGFLTPRQLEHGGIVLDLTAKGRAALEDPSATAEVVASIGARGRDRSAERASTGNQKESDVAEVDETLFGTLRTWRLEQAREQGVPAYVVFHNSHLRAIAARKPTTMEALLEVKGVGPRKLEKYGATVIKLIQEHMQKPGD
jgi:ATP-dependent DNA helicase RecQ